MGKPWDCIRNVTTQPIGVGDWYADDRGRTNDDVPIRVLGFCCDEVQLGIEESWFTAGELRQLSEFCNELADQLETESSCSDAA